MKKTLLALAAIAASSAAFAQSSVTLYGVVDASVESVKGNNTVTRVSSDNLASSRIAFKGVEDLGGGLKATFLLDAAVAVDTGAAGSTLFGRSAYVGLTGGFGTLRAGRPVNTLYGNAMFANGTKGVLKGLANSGLVLRISKIPIQTRTNANSVPNEVKSPAMLPGTNAANAPTKRNKIQFALNGVLYLGCNSPNALGINPS